jgi:hypothetical protein
LNAFGILKETFENFLDEKILHITIDAPPNSLVDSIVSLNVKTMEG